jgi:uncharacterized Zn finger protein
MSPRSKRKSFGETWWGHAWVSALEETAELNQNRLARGRAYARWNFVGPLKVEPGAVRARVAGSRATPYHTWVRVNPFTDEQWDTLLDVISSKVAHTAALMDGELSSQLVDDAREVNIELLPEGEDLTTGCSCPDDAIPCKHAAAVCYLFADLLDDDPFALLQLRGRTQEEIDEALRNRRQPVEVPVASITIDEIAAEEAFARTPGPLPSIPKAPSHPGSPATLSDIPESTGVSAHDLELLAQATAQRAWEMISGAGDSGLNDPVYIDLIRRLTPLLDTPDFDIACSQSKRIRSSVEEDARLWAIGGKVALQESNAKWSTGDDALEPAIKRLEPLGKVTVDGNRVTCQSKGVQLRLGQSGQWYEYTLRGTQWHFAGAAEVD